jgi:hypothetical protein
MDDGTKFQPVLKPFYEIYIRNNHVTQIVSQEVQGPSRPPESFPGSIYDIVLKVKELLEELGDRSRDKENQERQEVVEAKDSPLN